MHSVITFSELGYFILFAIFTVAGIYAVITLRSINRAVREVMSVFQRHRHELDQSIKNITATTANTVEISNELKKSAGEAENAIETISRNATDTVLRVNKTADQVATYVLVFGEIAKAIVDLFPAPKRKY